jgi:hypothetical protein
MINYSTSTVLDCWLAAVLHAVLLQDLIVIVFPDALNLTYPTSVSAVLLPPLDTALLPVEYGFLKSPRAVTAAVTTDDPVFPLQVKFPLIAVVSPRLHF